MDNAIEQSRGVAAGVSYAAGRRMVALETSFTTVLLDLSSLRRADPDLDLHYHSKQVDYTVGWLCDAAEACADDVFELAVEAQRAVQRLADALDAADSDDRRTRDKLDLARDAVAELLLAIREVARPAG